MANKALGVVEALGAVACFGAAILSWSLGSVPLAGLGLVLVHGAESHLKAA